MFQSRYRTSWRWSEIPRTFPATYQPPTKGIRCTWCCGTARTSVHRFTGKKQINLYRTTCLSCVCVRVCVCVHWANSRGLVLYLDRTTWQSSERRRDERLVWPISGEGKLHAGLHGKFIPCRATSHGQLQSLLRFRVVTCLTACR